MIHPAQQVIKYAQKSLNRNVHNNLACHISFSL
jgi:hypothetical protein